MQLLQWMHLLRMEMIREKQLRVMVVKHQVRLWMGTMELQRRLKTLKFRDGTEMDH
jgi:hypothetical protein